MPNENYYKLLEVEQGATKKEIEDSYKKLAKKYHPDFYDENNKSVANELMARINEAYNTLIDTDKRIIYDQMLVKQYNNIFLNKVIILIIVVLVIFLAVYNYYSITTNATLHKSVDMFPLILLGALSGYLITWIILYILKKPKK